ncbi:MAG: DUF1566 domain-containing protein [Candidatus Scalindua sp.]|nr:DUF1566 domain-containing protein [Candidatus Scalindua sp.]
MLEQQGWSVWWDRKIPPGRSFDEVIEEALVGARCVIVLWSKESVKSDWVKEEASEGARRKILVPVLIEDVGIPLGFRRIQAAQLIDWQGDVADPNAGQFIDSISAFIGYPQGEKPESDSKPAVGKQEERKPWQRGAKEESYSPRTKRPLRSQPREDLTEDKAQIMVKKKGYFDTKVNTSGAGITHEYEIRVDGMVVHDHATGLMWQQSGSEKAMSYKKAKAYIEALNRQQFAGFNDWRLPTIEEAISLREPGKKSGDLYIDPVFDQKQICIWTSDRKTFF